MKAFDSVNTNYIERYMCSTTFCPCVKVNVSLWDPKDWTEGNPLESKSYSFKGTNSVFERCYKQLLSKTVVTQIDPAIVGLIRALESKA